MGFATYQNLKQAIEDGKILSCSFSCSSAGGTGVGPFVGYWYNTSIRPTAGADPAGTPGTSYSNTAGGLIFPDTGTDKFIFDITTRTNVNDNAAALILTDRLVAVGGINFSSTGDKTINSTALPRYTSGVNVQAFAEISTAGTTTPAVISLASYTNQAGTPSRVGATTVTWPVAGMPKGSLVGPIPLQAGDTGIQSVETVNVATAAGGSGVMNIVLLRPLLYYQIDGGAKEDQKTSPFPYGFLVKIFDGFTGMFIMKSFDANSNPVHGIISTVVG